MEKEASCITSKAILDYVKAHNNGDYSGLLENIDPEIHLQKANEAVKADPDSSMDLAKSILLFSKGNDNKYLKIKVR